jgi:hypothetical protein
VNRRQIKTNPARRKKAPFPFWQLWLNHFLIASISSRHATKIVKKQILEKIKRQIIATFKEQYGYCGLAENSNQAMINSGGADENFIVMIQDQSAVKSKRLKVSKRLVKK